MNCPAPFRQDSILNVETPCNVDGYILVLDSGAVDYVQPPEIASLFPIEETYNSRAGVHYSSANGGKIINLGKRKLFGLTDNYDVMNVTVQICEGLKSTLLSVRKLTESGCGVVLDNDEGDYIYIAAADKYIPVYQEDGLYNINLWMDASKYKVDMAAGT